MSETPSSPAARGDSASAPASAREVERRRIQVVAASNLAIGGIGCLFLIQFYRLGVMPVFWALLVALVVVSINVLALFRTRRIKPAGYVSTSAMFLLVVAIAAVSGGFYDPSFSWLYVVPLAAAFLIDLTALVIFSGLVAATTVVFWLLPAGSLPAMVPVEMYPLHSLLMRLAIVLSLGMMTAFFVRMQQQALRQRKQANRSLQAEVEAHRATARALAESEAGLRDLIENSADMIWTHDMAGKILTANEPFASFLGLSNEELLGKRAERFVAEESRSTWDDYLAKVGTEGTYRGTMTLVGGDGSHRVLEFHNTLRNDGVGVPTVRALARDVSRQVASQEALVSRVDQEQLMVAISTRFIDAPADRISDEVDVALGEIGVFLGCERLQFFLLSGDGQGLERFAQWTEDGEPESEEFGRPVAISSLLPRLLQFETIVVERLSDLSEDARGDLTGLLGEDVRSATIVPVFTRDGLLGVLTLETKASEREWLREHQALAHIAGMIFGNAITRAREEGRTLRLRDEIQQARKMESLGLIAGGIAHDFNNLLMVVLGNASVAMAQVPDGSGAQEALQAIDSSARSAAKLTAQMLAYAGAGAVARQPVSLNEVVQDEVDQMRGANPEVVSTTVLDKDLPDMYADAALIRQVLRALLQNALEAMAEADGVSEAVVEVATRFVELQEGAPARGFRPIRNGVAAGGYCVFEVRDSGPGIEPPVLEKIFDPFFTTRFAGRGLGLAATLGAVRGHEGVIEVESDRSGTAVRVFVPVARSDERVRSAPPPEVEAQAEIGATTPSVLVIDSNPEVLDVLGGLLRSGGFEPVATSDALEALARLGGENSGFQAVVADLGIVETSDALLAARWRTEHIPWILSSDERKEDVAQRLAYAGASAFLSKPFEGRKLLSLLEGLLREYAPVSPAV